MNPIKNDQSYPVSFAEPKTDKGLIYSAIILLFCFAFVMFFIILSVLIRGDYQGGRADYQGTGNFAGLIGGFFCCTGLPLIGCATLWIILNKKKKKLKVDRDQWMMIHIIHFAKQNSGRISIPDIIVNLQVTAEDAKKVVDELVLKGVLQVMVTPSGALVYQLTGLDENQAMSI
jgi:hypothetical protein